MDLNFYELKEALEVASSLVVPVAGIAISFFSWKKTGEIDLHKTLEHAKDVFQIVQKLIDDGTEENEAIKKGVEEIQKIRGHKISKKMKRKAEARIRSLLGK